ncbi:DUF4334 domain-containing protein [Aetokthonos hydrillicola Thurmond2011]|jgi:hypothetical protein|uniref:DUF4334 domain-containing protein n=1 Tax=Aetokthonos hydrillicola Thurmond2011 TaxID=2712845 RepID=A0AAP5M3H5_9CYAN|nr:DUF4334 domain-containing protein [Aetokthonos hydrillicola]MBO3457503.1 DUF4334 domain-containing protein [Aetokthonos hydrillicola CCALA 1050]MBW4585974.1 DUF4334 domain-containing protein [Aetokthonos hydrillicola CCALA 1050]MDR9893796.1 DUF4334 domain-containing protein [Aetokthonos hydrillicola Thurmond2011]
MQTLETYDSILKSGQTTTEKALELFDALEPVNLTFMLGRWRGSGLHTNHPMDGYLEQFNWYGKEFVDPEHVHPLLFFDNKGKVIKVEPKYMSITNLALKFPILKNDFFKPLGILTNSLLKTEKSQARLRMVEYRSKVSATMIYDHFPINDAFRKIDDNTLLGVMDLKNSSQPFFFILRRDSTN